MTAAVTPRADDPSKAAEMAEVEQQIMKNMQAMGSG
jgi:hypothetical protein